MSLRWWPWLGQAAPAEPVDPADTASAILGMDIETLSASLMANGARIILIIVVIAVGLWLIRRLLQRFGMAMTGQQLIRMDDKARRLNTFLRLGYTLLTIVVWALGTLAILSILGINIAPFIAGAGVLGIAVGFGSQSLVKDVLSGFFLLMDDRIRVGDVVELGGVSGVVERLDLRSVTLRAFNGDAQIIPWGTLDRVTNMTYQWSRTLLDVGVDYRAEPDKVIAVMLDTAQALREDPRWSEDFLGEPEVLGIIEFADSAVVYRVTMQVRNARQWAIGRELRRRLWYAFREQGIEFPFPHRTLVGHPAEPLLIQMVEAEGVAPGTNES